jgi:hypothetical protein
MRNTLASAAAIAALVAFAAPASAATLLSSGVSGTPLSEVIKLSSGVDGNLITFYSVPSNFALDYSSTSTLHASSTGGFAFVEGVGTHNANGFADLTIVPETVTFSAFKFNMQLPSATSPAGSPDPTNKTTFTFDAQVFFAGGGSQTFSDIIGGNGENRMLITAGLNEAINKIVFSDLEGTTGGVTNLYNFDSLRQVSFDAIGGVPEPATWALFILGFGFIGTMLRSARARQGASLTA